MSIFDRFTEGARRAVVAAQDYARSYGHNYIGSEHLLMGLLKDENCEAARSIATHGVHFSDVVQKLDEVLGKGSFEFTDSFGFTPRTKKILESSLYEARELRRNYVGTEHLLLGLCQTEDSVAGKVLCDAGITPEYVQRMWGGTVSLEDIEKALAVLKAE